VRFKSNMNYFIKPYLEKLVNWISIRFFERTV